MSDYVKCKGEFMIIGTQEEVLKLATNQKRFVGPKYDVTGAIACVCLDDFAKQNFRNPNSYVTGIDENGNERTFKCGSQCKWLWNGSYNNPKSWRSVICDMFNVTNLKNLYVLCVFFTDGVICDGNPFIGGTQDIGEDIFETAVRELNEEVGLKMSSYDNICKVPTIKNKYIWAVEAKYAYDSGANPIRIGYIII